MAYPIVHFTHPGHQLKPVYNNEEFLCDGCNTTGIGKQYRCHGCNFDLHDYCGKCPQALSSFMHNHSLTLTLTTCQVTRMCDICTDPVEGLFYRCRECDFDVHPLCTQFPKKLQHALDKIHPLNLESSGIAGLCTVCRGSCNGWRYRCRICRIDIHLECVLVPVVVQSQQNFGTGMNQRGVPFQPPPIFAPDYGFGPGYPNFGPVQPNLGPNYGPGFNMYNNGYPQNLLPRNNQ